MRKFTIIVLLVSFATSGLFCQRLNNKYSYSNLKGVERLGVNYRIGADDAFGAGIDYAKILNKKCYFKVSGEYMEYDRISEESFYGKVSLTYGIYLFNISRRIYTRGLLGVQSGYERKQSKVIDDEEDFMFYGAHIGFEPEIFIAKNIVLYLGYEQYAHYYMNNGRVSWDAYGGIRVCF